MKSSERNKIHVLLTFAEPLNVALPFLPGHTSSHRQLYTNVQQSVKPLFAHAKKKRRYTRRFLYFCSKNLSAIA